MQKQFLKPERVETIDLHMHTSVSDGTDTPQEILDKVVAAGIELFSVTDHDDIQGAVEISRMQPIQDADVLFIKGAEFSCRDEDGKYHILGYQYDETSPELLAIIRKAHDIRIQKVQQRLEFLKEEFGFTFKDEDIEKLFHNSNPGKPHIAKLMIQYGYASDIPGAMKNYLNKKKFKSMSIDPGDAIRAILAADGIPVLAHPSYGDGSQIIVGAMMNLRLKKLVSYGLQGVECYYSGFTDKLIHEMLGFAEQYDLYVTAGSDYHGENKMVPLGETNLTGVSEGSARVRRFIDRCFHK